MPCRAGFPGQPDDDSLRMRRQQVAIIGHVKAVTARLHSGTQS